MRNPEREIEALWTAVFGQPPAVHASAELLIEILVSCLPPPPPYGAPPAVRADTAAGGGAG